ncbi:MAG: bifunctional adenosylcobinamide kinase/adenosylcobinamide-phosphate guanylyltransferase [Rhodospirillales bacterium]|nr:bifunctional adenosylcobinamide kinase/adenosylcobinamide-phosphate guanylyltransferase [Rhodospirillales bacterium]
MNIAPHSSLPPVTLILGGARSGKSRYAELLVEAVGGGVYLATATVEDNEMAERIRQHRQRRGQRWTTIEEPLEILTALQTHASPERPVLLDCLTLWLSNIMAADRDIEHETKILAEGLGRLKGPVVLVSNEVGLGLVPTTPLGRTFRDHAGRLNQAVAGVADRAVFVAAGLPMTLKETTP